MKSLSTEYAGIAMTFNYEFDEGDNDTPPSDHLEVVDFTIKLPRELLATMLDQCFAGDKDAMLKAVKELS